jgi:hypothetical protein
MNRVAAWLLAAADPWIVRRASVTSLVVGTVLTMVNRGPEILDRGVAPEAIWPIVLTYLTPYVVATISSLAARRSPETAPSRRDCA